MKINIITGFRDDQKFSIDIEEAHKAYYLFNNPEERGVFKNGLAIRGQDIQRIEPNYQGTMGWNETHQLDNDDWNEIRGKRIDEKFRTLLKQANDVSRLPELSSIELLSEAIKFLPPDEFSEEVKQLSTKMKV